MRKLIVILLFALSSTYINGQNISTLIENLDIALAKNDTLFYSYSKAIAHYYQYLCPDSSLMYLDSAISVANYKKDIAFEIEFLFLKAKVLDIKLENDDAVNVYFNILSLLSDQMNSYKYADALVKLSFSLYKSNTKNEVAKKYLFQALDIAEVIRNDIIKINAYDILSNIYSDNGNADSALLILNKAIFLSENLSDKNIQATNYFFLAKIYYNQKDYIPAITYLKRSISLVKNDELLNKYNLFLAVIYYKMEHFSSASNVFNKVFISYIQNNNKIGLLNLYINLAEFNNSQNKYNLAIENAINALNLSRQLNISIFQIKSYYLLSTFYSENQQVDSALNFYQKYSNLRDSVFSLSLKNESELLFNNYILQLKLKDQQLLFKQKQYQILKNKQQSLAIYILAVSGILLIITIFILLRSYNLKTKSEYRLKQITEATLEGILIHDGRKILEVNDKYCNISGFSRDELIGNSLTILLTDKSQEIVKAKMNLKKTVFYQMELLKKDGTVFNAEVLSKPFVFKELTAKIVSVRDLTEIKEIKEKLQTTKEQFETLVEISPDGVVITDTAGIITYVSPAFNKIFGNEQNDFFIGKDLSDFVTDIYKNKLKVDLSNIMFGNYEGITEYMAYKLNGEEFYIECNGNFFKDSKGKISGVFMIVRDVNERKIVENALIASESRFRGLFNNAKDAIIILNRNFKIVDANPYTSEMLLYSFEELLTMDFRELLPPDLRNLKFNEIVENNNIFESYIYIKNRKKIYIQVTFSTMLYPDGNYFLLTIRDLTLFKRQEENLTRIATKLQESNATKDKMFSIIGHDLRGPIGSLKTMIEFIDENPDEFDEAELVDVISSMRDTSNQTYELLENLLSWAKTQQNLHEFSPSEFDIVEIASNLVNFSNNIAKTKNIDIILIHGEHFNVIADENMIKSVIRNLLSNAIKFSKPDSKVIVEIIDKIDKALIKIIDKGVGISEQNLQYIFKEGSFVTTYGTNNEKGTGLGLKLCMDFVKKNNGKIWFESQVEKGTTFYFTLKKA